MCVTRQIPLSVFAYPMFRRCASIFCLCLLVAPITIAAQGAPVIGQAYDLELSDGTRLKNAVYRGVKDGADAFELKSVVGLLQLKAYRVLPAERRQGLMAMAGMQYLLPYDQKQLGFSESLSGQLSVSLPLLRESPAWVPRLWAGAGFTRFSGSKALLSGPEISAGPAWLLTLTQNHHLFLNLSAGAGFYRLFNQSLNETFSQNTFIALAEAGYALRLARWGVSLSYVQQYIHDSRLPLNAGGIRFAAVYFGGNV